jgi:hypothetical protein
VGVANHSFPLTLSEQTSIVGIDSVLECYKRILPQLAFSGPTYFSPIIRQILSNIQSEKNSNVYNIFLILTDGMINDMMDTINVLVEASYLPLSVIIIGVGNSDFSNMNELDADTNALIDSKGRRALRDIVQFVPYQTFSRDPVKLAEQVLAEVPKQLVQYFRFIKRPPSEPIV